MIISILIGIFVYAAVTVPALALLKAAGRADECLKEILGEGILESAGAQDEK